MRLSSWTDPRRDDKEHLQCIFQADTLQFIFPADVPKLYLSNWYFNTVPF
jgi:hypothetical protein